VNEEIVHGVPSDLKLPSGDLVKLDVTVEAGGFMADACETVGVGSITQEAIRLINHAVRAFIRAFLRRALVRELNH
jgi:methionyl aminopeptidase